MLIYARVGETVNGRQRRGQCVGVCRLWLFSQQKYSQKISSWHILVLSLAATPRLRKKYEENEKIKGKTTTTKVKRKKYVIGAANSGCG